MHRALEWPWLVPCPLPLFPTCTRRPSSWEDDSWSCTAGMGKNSPSVPLPLVLYLVTSGTARSQQLCMMAATVEMPIVVKVDEVYQGLTTGLASKTGSVPAALLTSPGRKHSILSWIQQLLALPKQRPWALNLNLLSFAHGSSITFPNPHSNCSYAAGPSPPQRPTPQTWLPLFPNVYQITNPENIFRYPPPNPFCRAKRGGRERLRDGGGTDMLPTFSQVYPSSLGGNKRATPCPMDFCFRWAQKSRSWVSSSSPRARQ